MTENKEYTRDELTQKTEIAIMQKDIEFIKKTLEELPKAIIDGVMAQVELIKNQAVEQYRREAECKYALKSEIKILEDQTAFENSVKGVIEKQIGKWFLATVGASSVIVGLIIWIVNKII